MDQLWLQITVGIDLARQGLDTMLAPLHIWGPIPVILLLSLLTVGLTKILSRTIKTKRHAQLKKEFEHWHQVRQEAVQCADREKGRQLAKNIDQGQLNRVYYDYFFEGLMLSLVTRYLPILVMAAYVNETYRPANLITMLGRDHLFPVGTAESGEPLLMGALFFFVSTLIATYLVWGLGMRWLRRRKIQGAPRSRPACVIT